MSSKKKYEFRSREKEFGRNSEGLRQRRLKDESRWKFNPNESYESEDDLEDDEEYGDWEQYRQGG